MRISVLSYIVSIKGILFNTACPTKRRSTLRGRGGKGGRVKSVPKTPNTAVASTKKRKKKRQPAVETKAHGKKYVQVSGVGLYGRDNNKWTAQRKKKQTRTATTTFDASINTT